MFLSSVLGLTAGLLSFGSCLMSLDAPIIFRTGGDEEIEPVNRAWANIFRGLGWLGILIIVLAQKDVVQRWTRQGLMWLLGVKRRTGVLADRGDQGCIIAEQFAAACGVAPGLFPGVAASRALHKEASHQTVAGGGRSMTKTSGVSEA